MKHQEHFIFDDYYADRFNGNGMILLPFGTSMKILQNLDEDDPNTSTPKSSSRR